MLFLRKRLKNTCLNWISDNSEYFRGKMDSLLREKATPSDEECEEIFKNANNQYFKKAAELINTCNNPHAKLRWTRIPLQPDVCGVEIDYNSLSIGIVYIMLYYCFSGMPASKEDIQIYTELNHINHNLRNSILEEFVGE